MGEGNGNGKALVLGCGMSALHKELLVAQRQFACVSSNLLSYLFCRILDPDVFSGLRCFFRNPAEHFAGLRSGTFFRPKEDCYCLHEIPSESVFESNGLSEAHLHKSNRGTSW